MRDEVIHSNEKWYAVEFIIALQELLERYENKIIIFF